MYQQPAAPAINSAADTLGWPFRDPRWVNKILIMGLITLIPIVGVMTLFGWTLQSLDNLRQGRQEMAEAGFSGLGRGVMLFVVFLVYFGVLFGVYFVLLVLGGAMGGSNNGAASGVGVVFLLLGLIWYYGGLLVLALLLPSIILATDRDGIGGGLNIPAVIARVRAHPGPALMAGLFSLIAYVISGFGVIACFIGVLFTTAWAYAVLAGLVYWLERQQGGPVVMQPPSGYMPPPPPPPAPT